MSKPTLYDPLEDVELRDDYDAHCKDCDGPCDGCCHSKPQYTIDELVDQALKVVMSNSPEFIAKFHVKFLEALAKTK